jgi:7-cyano-7-deazaguanine synthase in queuosine biosynthesis
MAISSVDLLKAHNRGFNTHTWHYLPRDGSPDLPVPLGEIEQELSELVYCLYLMEKFKFNSNELEFISSDPKRLEDILPHIVELYRIMVEHPITVKLRKGTVGNGRVIQKSLSTELDLNETSLFSGGVDSTVGMLLLKRDNARVILSHTKTGTVPYARAKRVLAQSGSGLQFVVSDATLRRQSGWKDSGDPVIHSRGLIFLTNAMLVAHSLGLPRVILPENGPFVLNIETTSADKSTRTTHPLLVESISRVSKELSGKGIQIEVPFAQWTKAEIMSADVLEPLLRHTHSCFYTQGQERANMCGVCYSCAVRSLSAYATGVEQSDGMYNRNVLELPVDTASNRDKLEILHGVFRFYSRVLSDPARLSDRLRDSYLGRLYTRDAANDMLYRFACDLILGAKKMLEVKDNARLGPFGRYVSKLLSRIEQEPLDAREEQLAALKTRRFQDWDFSIRPF